MSTAIGKQTGIGLAICAVLATAPLAIFRLAGLTGEGWFLVQTVIQASAVIIGGVLLSQAKVWKSISSGKKISATGISHKINTYCDIYQSMIQSIGA